MPQLAYDLVVVPLDFSEASQNALAAAVEMAGDSKKVHAVHVLPPLEAMSPGVVWGDVSDDRRETAVREFAQKFLTEHGAEDATFVVRFGSAGHEITSYADENNASLIVVSSHGFHGIKRMLLGSVAEAVIRHAHCPVLVMRRTDAE